MNENDQFGGLSIGTKMPSVLKNKNERSNEWDDDFEADAFAIKLKTQPLQI